MTLATTTNKATYDGDGATTVFPVPFKFFDNAHVEAVLRDSTGAEATWTESTEYMLAGAGNDTGGTLTAITAPTDFTPQSGETLVVRRVIPLTQETDYPEGGAFPASAHEDALDLAAMRDQQVQEENERSLRYPITDSPEISAEIPNSTTRAGKYLAFDANGDPIAAVDPGSYPASAFGASLIDDADAAAALTTLGVSAFAKTLIDDADAPAARNTLGLLPYLGKNALINGNFAVWQRGTSFTPGAGSTAFIADRWFTNRATANYTVSRQGTAEQYSLRLQRDSGDTGTDDLRLWHVIESANCAPLIGQTVQLSFDAKVGADFSPTSGQMVARLAYGTGVDEGRAGLQAATWAGYVHAEGNITPTTSWVRYTFEATIPSTAKEIGLLLRFTPTGTAGANDWLEVRNIQLEAGDQATDFLHRDIGIETALCQRYYQEHDWQSGDVVTVLQAVSSGNARGKFMDFPARMRVVPTASVSGQFRLLNASTSAAGNITGLTLKPTVSSLGVAGVTLGSSPLVAGDATYMDSLSSPASLALDAEL